MRVIDLILAAVLLPLSMLIFAALWLRGHLRWRGHAAPRMMQIISSTLEKELQRGFQGRILRTDFGYFDHVWHLHSFADARRDVSLGDRHTAVEFTVPVSDRLKAWGLGWTSRVWYAWALSAAVIELICREQIAVIDTADAFLTGAQAWLFAWLTGIPYAIEIHRAYHDDYASFGQPIFGLFKSGALERIVGRFVIRRAARVIVDRAYYWEAAKRLGAVPEQAIRTRLVADPVFYDASEPAADVRRQLGLPATQPLVLFVGRLSYEKFPDDVVRATSVVARNFPEAVVVMAGDGPMRRDLEQLAQNLGLQTRVRFLGVVLQPALRFLMREAAVLVCPNTGLAMLEAALCGCPLVAYDSDWHPEVIASPQEGVLVRHRDHQALGQAVCEMLRHPERAKQMAARLRDRLMREHAPERFQQDMRAGFQELLGVPAADASASLDLTPVGT